MSQKNGKDETDESIFRVETVPPPAGDDDAYNAATRVGPASSDEWVELIRQADAQGKKAADAMELAPTSTRPRRPKLDSASPAERADSAPFSSPQPRTEQSEDVPRLYAEEIDDVEASNAATRLHLDSDPGSDAVPAPSATNAAEVLVRDATPSDGQAETPPPQMFDALWLSSRPRSSRLAVVWLVCLLVIAAGLAAVLLRS